MIWNREQAGVISSVILMVGCTAEVPPQQEQGQFTVRDSAGISIAESTTPFWTAETSWRISPEPSLVIGSRDAREPGTDFGFVGSASRLGDGRLVLVESTSSEIRVFDRNGRLLFTAGGWGQGPGEFTSPPWIFVIHGDSIVAADFEASKLVVFGPDGSLGRTVRTPPVIWNGLTGVSVAGVLQDGSFLISHAPQTSDLPSGRSILAQEYHLFGPTGTHLGEFARVPFLEGSNEGEGRGPVTFGALGYARHDPTGLWFGFSNVFSLKHMSVEGVDKILRIPVSPEPIPERLKKSYRESYANRMGQRMRDTPPERRARVEEVWNARLKEMVFADSLPLFGGLEVARDGHLWVQGYPTVEELLSPEWDWNRGRRVPRWTVFDPEGRWLGEVDMPSGIQVYEIGADYVLGVRTDELDVPYVVLLRIEKPRDE